MDAMDVDSTGEANTRHAPRSATERVFEVPELVTLIFRNLKRDRVDLLALSQVSRRLRQSAIPLLLEELDIPLSSLKRFLAAFRIRPARYHLQHIKFLRLWDDNVVQRWRCDFGLSSKFGILGPSWRHGFAAQIAAHAEHEQFDPRWTEQVAELFDLLSTTQKQPFPLLDLTFSVISGLALAQTFAKFPESAKRVTAVRVIDHLLDHHELELFKNIGFRNSRGPAWWQGVTELVRIITAAQDQTSAPRLKVFSLETSQEVSGSASNSPKIWEELLKYLRPHIEDLTLNFTSASVDSYNFGPLLEGVWPNLRRIWFNIGNEPATDEDYDSDDDSDYEPENFDDIWDARKRLLDDFLGRHPDLEDVRIQGSEELRPLSSHRTMLKLRRLRLQNEGLLASDLTTLLAQNANLDELELHDSSIEGLTASLLAVSGSRHIQKYRGSLRHLKEFLEAGYTFAHLCITADGQFTCFDHISGKLDSRSASRITCLTIRTIFEKLDDLVPMMGAAFHWSQFPNLAELSFRCNHTAEQASAKSWRHLRRLLLAMRSARNLRVLRVEWDAAEPLPPYAKLRGLVSDKDIPPSLEYIAWFVPVLRRTQYLRVQQTSDLGTRELAYLPASSRSHVDKDGIWNQSADIEASGRLLDHSVFPPRLLA